MHVRRENSHAENYSDISAFNETRRYAASMADTICGLLRA